MEEETTRRVLASEYVTPGAVAGVIKEPKRPRPARASRCIPLPFDGTISVEYRPPTARVNAIMVSTLVFDSGASVLFL